VKSALITALLLIGLRIPGATTSQTRVSKQSPPPKQATTPKPISLQEAIKTTMNAWRSPAEGRDYPIKALVDLFGEATEHDALQWHFNAPKFEAVLVHISEQTFDFGSKEPEHYFFRLCAKPGYFYDFSVKAFQTAVRSALRKKHPSGNDATTEPTDPRPQYLLLGKGMDDTGHWDNWIYDSRSEVGTVAAMDESTWEHSDIDGIVSCSIAAPAWTTGSKRVFNAEAGKYDNVSTISLWDYENTDKFLSQARVSGIEVIYAQNYVHFKLVPKIPDFPLADDEVAAAIKQRWKMDHPDNPVVDVWNSKHEFDAERRYFIVSFDMRYTAGPGNDQKISLSWPLKWVHGKWLIP